jgi:two-component system, NarL family, response regulator DegU
MGKVTVMIIDEQGLFRAGVRQVLSQYPAFEILECAPSEDTLRFIETSMPDVAIVGCRLSAEDGLDLGKKIARYFPNTKVIMLSPDPNDEEIFEVIKTSAVACLNKNASADELVSTIRSASNGEYPINEAVMTRPSVARHVLKQFEEIDLMGSNAVETLVAPITFRETEVLIYVANGNTNKQIGAALQISEQTIKNHVSAILRKLNANDRAHAVVMAVRNGWISVDATEANQHPTSRG